MNMAAGATARPDRRDVAGLRGRMAIPVIVAPMFLISSPDMVIAAANSGIIAAFPAANARTIEAFDEWCRTIVTALGDRGLWAVNLIMHPSYSRLGEEIAVIARYRPPLVISALGS